MQVYVWISINVIYLVTFYFLKFLYDQTVLVLDECYFQTRKIITKSIGIIWQKRCQHNNLQIFGEIVTFSSFICLIKLVFFLLLFSGYYLALFSFYL